MKDITLDVFWKNRAENSSEESSPILVTGIRLNRWIQSNYDTQGESVFERPVNFGMLFLVLTLLYSDYFMTEEEHEKEVKMIVNGKQVPYYTQNAILKNIDVIEVDVWKDQHYRLISLEEACLNFFV